MKQNNFLANLLAKLKPVLGWIKQPIQATKSLSQRFKTAFASWLERKKGIAKDDVSHTFKAMGYPGSRARQYLVHVPLGKAGQHPRPLIMVLHGCRQNNRDIEQIS